MKNHAPDTKHLVGSRIKQMRKVRNLSQEELAEKTGMSSKYLSSIERGLENPTFDAFLRISRALDIPVYELFNYSSQQSQKEIKNQLIDLISNSDKDRLELAGKIIRGIYL
jgi:transcriptional regulator with XRE-family HTH domain